MQDSPGRLRGRQRNKRKGLIQAQELILKNRSNNAKYTKQNKKKKKKKVNLQIITPSVEETNYFVC